MTWIYAMPFKGRHAILKYGAKLTGKAVEAFDTELALNLWDHEELRAVISGDALRGWSGSSEITNGLGPPNVIVRSWESSPGVWWLRDQESSWEFLAISDGWKKHPWKGGSIEIVKGTGELDTLASAYARLVSCLAYTSLYYGPNKDKMKDLVRQSLGVKQ